MRRALPLLGILAALGCRERASGVPASTSASSSAARAATLPDAAARSRRPSAEPGIAPVDPKDVGRAERSRVVLMTAAWCQWCQVFKAQVLPDGRVKQALQRHFEFSIADVDRAPAWLDLPGVEGLPSLIFFDAEGRHVLTRSGYREPGDTAELLQTVATKLEHHELEPYPARPEGPALPSEAIDPNAAKRALAQLESKLFFAVNSNDGGFRSPARHPQPDLLLELSQWSKRETAPPRVRKWITLTLEHALRGHSPRLAGKPLPDMSFDAKELASLTRPDARGTARWRAGIDQLYDQDPFLGIQDPIDFGVFRYAAGPGWYNPHFERRALDNLSWVLLLQNEGHKTEAARIERFVEATFAQGPLLGAVQIADPFYYRLRADERRAVPAPRVERLWLLEVQARAARVFPQRCKLLLRARGDRWPRAEWTERGEAEGSPDATPDAVGELLLALGQCPGDQYRALGRALGATVERWARGPLPTSSSPTRLHRLAAGLCEATPTACGRALAAVAELGLDLDYAPPLTALARAAAP